MTIARRGFKRSRAHKHEIFFSQDRWQFRSIDSHYDEFYHPESWSEVIRGEKKKDGMPEAVGYSYGL